MRTLRPTISALLLGASLALGACDGRGDSAGAEVVAAVSESGGPETTARLALDQEIATPADLVVLRIEWVCSQGWAPDDSTSLPRSGEEFGGLEVRGSTPIEPRLGADGRTVQGRAITLAPLTPGDYEIPSFTIRFRRIDSGEVREVATEPMTIQVVSLLPEGDPGDLASRKGVVDPPAAPAWPWIVSGALALAMAALLIAAVVRRRSDRPEPVVPEPPPHEEALAALAALLARGLPARGEFDAHFTSLSSILRRYIERRFSLHAPRLTTEEFLHAARRDDSFRADDAREIERFLRLSDTVKFARFSPTEREAGEAFDVVKGFVQRTAKGPEEGGPP